MGSRRTAMIAGACLVLGAWSAEARAELHRFAFRGTVGDIPTPLVSSPVWTGISRGDPMLISFVLDTPDEVFVLNRLDVARLVSVSLVIGGRLESTDGAGSTIRATLEEGIAPAGAVGAHNVKIDLVLPSGVRVLVDYVSDLGGAHWAIGETSGLVRLSTRGLHNRFINDFDAADLDTSFGERQRLTADLPSIQTPSPGGIAVFAPGLALMMRRKRS